MAARRRRGRTIRLKSTESSSRAAATLRSGRGMRGNPVEYRSKKDVTGAASLLSFYRHGEGPFRGVDLSEGLPTKGVKSKKRRKSKFKARGKKAKTSSAKKTHRAKKGGRKTKRSSKAKKAKKVKQAVAATVRAAKTVTKAAAKVKRSKTPPTVVAAAKAATTAAKKASVEAIDATKAATSIVTAPAAKKVAHKAQALAKQAVADVKAAQHAVATAETKADVKAAVQVAKEAAKEAVAASNTALAIVKHSGAVHAPPGSSQLSERARALVASGKSAARLRATARMLAKSAQKVPQGSDRHVKLARAAMDHYKAAEFLGLRGNPHRRRHVRRKKSRSRW